LDVTEPERLRNSFQADIQAVRQHQTADEARILEGKLGIAELWNRVEVDQTRPSVTLWDLADTKTAERPLASFNM